MKYIKTLLLLFVTTTLFAQNPTFEQTVEYIQTNTVGRMLYKGPLDSYQRANGHKLTKISIEKNGRIKLIADQKNGTHDFEIVFNIFDLTSSIDYPDGIRAYKFLVHFKGLNVTSGYGITFATENDAIKVARALRHLKSLCSQEGDLFSQPTKEESRPTLSKSETIAYIKKLINEQPDLKYYPDDHDEVLVSQRMTDGIFYIEKKDKFRGTWDNTKRRYTEEEFKYNIDLTTASFVEVITYNKGDYLSGADLFYSSFDSRICVKLKTTNYITLNHKGRDGLDQSSISQAIRATQAASYHYKKETVNTFEIYLNNISDAKRLKKAFDHLNSLIKEEKNLNAESDPFGG